MQLIPLKKGSKAPRDTAWTTRDYTDKEVQRWRASGGNIGLRLGPTDLVLDIDPQNNREGLDADEILDQLDKSLGSDLRSAPRNRTGRGGIHVLMTKPADMRVKKYPFTGRRDLEFKIKGSQIVAPGSIHPDTLRPYVEEKTGDPMPIPDVLREHIERVITLSTGKVVDVQVSQVARCLELLDPTEFREHDTWLKLGMSVHAATGGGTDGKQLWLKWCWSDPHYEGDEEVAERWDTFHPDGDIGASTLFYFTAKVAGFIPPAEAADDFEAWEEPENFGPYQPEWRFTPGKNPKIKAGLVHNCLEAMRALAPDVGWNEHSKSLVWTTDLRALEDTDIRSLIFRVSESWGAMWSGDPTEAKMNAAVELYGQEHSFHPVRDYLGGLVWDGKPRVGSWLCDYTEAEDNAYVRAVGKLLLVAAVARIYKPGVKYDNVVVFEGPQGSGKSTLVRMLGGQWAIEGLPVLGTQSEADTVDRIRDKWIIEIDEMVATKKSDVDYVKAFVSRTADNVRLAYDRRKMHFPRQCVFIGTTNDANYLRDMTGNRRWLPVEVGECQFLRVETDRDQLWGEARILFEADPMQVLALPRSLLADATAEQEERMMADAFEEPIRRFLCEIQEGSVSTEEVVNKALSKSYPGLKQSELVRIGHIMRRAGWEKTKRRLSNGARLSAWKAPDND